MAYNHYRIHLTAKLLLGWIVLSSTAHAQIIPDGTLGSENSQIVPNDGIAPSITINGGAMRNSSLFHSFQEFNVGNSQQVYFDNPAGIQNIFSRVTGGNSSQILGTLGVTGGANLFFLNPYGIVFGPNAQLDIQGSFLATTAESLLFDNFQFSARNPQGVPESSLLSINTPLGLQFGASPGPIQVLGASLKLPPDRTLALVGGDVAIEGNPELSLEEQLSLATPGGRIEIGSVGSNGQVSITPVSRGLALGYEQVQTFRDITLSQQASVNVGDLIPLGFEILPSGEIIPIISTSESGSGEIHLQGRQIRLTDGSQILSANFFKEPGGMIDLTASESVELMGTSTDGRSATGLTSNTLGSGKGADITIKTGQLVVRDGATISTGTILSSGRGGNLTVVAAELIEVRGSSATAGNSLLSVEASAAGEAGNLSITTGRLIIRDGGQITAETSGSGQGGNLKIVASDSLELSGTGVDVTLDPMTGAILETKVAPSSLIATSTGPGKAGNIEIETNQLTVQDGAEVTASSFSSGNAGTIDVDGGSISLANQAKLTAETTATSTGEGGSVILKTRQLTVLNGSEVTVSSLNPENIRGAGDIKITAGSIELANQGQLTAETASGNGGNINLAVQDQLVLRTNSQISTTAGTVGNVGDGGNITIDAPSIVAVPAENSNIRADAFGGQGGNIFITTNLISGLALVPTETFLSGSLNTPPSKISASGSVSGGRIALQSLVPPPENIVTPPPEVVDASQSVQPVCGPSGAYTRGEFVITGRGGLPPAPTESINLNPGLVDLGNPNLNGGEPPTNPANREQSQDNSPPPIVEAQGWIRDASGKVVLTAQLPAVTPSSPALTPATCHDLRPVSAPPTPSVPLFSGGNSPRQ